MLLDFLVDYSRDPELRKELARDPAKVFARYEISPADQKHLESHDREAIASRLHEEIERGFVPTIWAWAIGTPVILGDPKPSQGAVGESLSIAIDAQDLAPRISVEFFNSTNRVPAQVTSVDQKSDGTSTINCTATFSNKGTYSLSVTNLIAGQGNSTSRPNCFNAK